MVKVKNKITAACIVMMMEQYNKRKKFTLEGVLFTKEEIIKRANTLFPKNTRVKKGDMMPSSLHAECLQKGSDDSLAEYFRLCSPDEENFSDLTETLENEEVQKVLKSHLPSQYSNKGKFIESYYQFVSELVMPPQERKNLDSREAVWIAAALTYTWFVTDGERRYNTADGF